MAFYFGAPAQDNSDEPLDEEAVDALVEELASGLADLIEDEDQAAIADAVANAKGMFRLRLLRCCRQLKKTGDCRQIAAKAMRHLLSH